MYHLHHHHRLYYFNNFASLLARTHVRLVEASSDGFYVLLIITFTLVLGFFYKKPVKQGKSKQRMNELRKLPSRGYVNNGQQFNGYRTGQSILKPSNQCLRCLSFTFSHTRNPFLYYLIKKMENNSIPDWTTHLPHFLDYVPLSRCILPGVSDHSGDRKFYNNFYMPALCRFNQM